MIYLIVGENSYAAQQALARITAQGAAEVERYDATLLDEHTLSDSMRGATLFANERVIVIKQLSEQKLLWEKFAEWAQDVSADTTLIVMEQKIDKRTKAYKTLVKHATVIAADYWTDRDVRQAETWLEDIAREHSVTLSRDQLRDMVQRAYIPGERPGQLYIDQMQLVQAITALRVLDAVTDEAIAAVLPPAPGETVFQLLEYALARDSDKVARTLREVHASVDPYAAFAAVAKQWTQLVAVMLAGNQARDLAIHPYVLGKLRQAARDVSRGEAQMLTDMAATLDARMKRSEVSAAEGLDRLVMAITLR